MINLEELSELIQDVDNRLRYTLIQNKLNYHIIIENYKNKY